jgi:ASC-1-like (ASCH) protein
MTSYDSSIDYKLKYIKYKAKYLGLKSKNLQGGSLSISEPDMLTNIINANYDPLKGFGTKSNYDSGYDTFDDKRLKVFEKDKEFHVTLKEPWFTYIKEGRKTVEGRINKGLFKHLKPGDIVIFMNGYDKVKVKISSKEVYPSFEEMLTKEILSQVLPNIKSVAEGINVYRQYFTEDVEQQNGVVALRFSKQN